ncbi:hypothetical protein Pla22_44180 [Rubripirellula amarantea]|uniref:Peptidase C-terminal archaeal/bacterial domain-containing protein n=1 Tax=Rubripirellula amarantea TaxID=2527999 RepID=A0A5C5WE29_9BACT|nr:PPC domain-containing protein [Rubripirellula amarantea]TWT49226.1 hypothetical protein Pla22_44180 [Rubripirellula amarantea]
MLIVHRYLLAALSVVCTTSAFASFPVVSRSEPLGAVRGEEATFTFHGTRLGDAHSAIADLPGIEILEVKAVDGKKATVKIKSDPNLAPGLYPIRLVTQSGISNIRLVGIGAMPVVQEVEPNDSFDSPQAIEMNTTVEGVVNREDLDHYSVDLKAGDQLNVEIEGIRLTYSLNNQRILDPFIAILDEGRFEVATSDDSSLLGQDGVCTFTAEKDGRYTVLVRESSFGGDPTNGYRLHVGNFPRPIATFPGGGVPGEVLVTKLHSLDGSESETSVTLPSASSDRFPVITETESGISPSPNWIRVNPLPVVMETEPNNDHTKAPEFEVPAAFCGVLQEPGDFDNFAWQCKKGEKYRIQVYARGLLRSPVDAVMNLFAPDNKHLVSSDDVGVARDPFVEFTAAVDGRHTLRIYDHLRGGSPLHHYRIEVEKATPTFHLTLKELRRDEAGMACVPVGGQTAIMAQVARKGYNDEINIEIEGLPAGVEAKTFAIPQGRAEIPVFLSAAADAQPTASLFRLVGKGSEKHPDVVGTFGQNHKLVLGQNRRALFEYETEKAAVAITEKAPFKIELTQPQTPIVREGSKNLRVTITRDEGFDKEVRIRTLYNPPGIGVNNSLKIAADKNEVDIPITANGGAAIGSWPIILMANYPAAHGSADIATPVINLDVQDLYFKYEFPRVAAELGTDAIVSVKLTVARPYEGDAEVQLVGLPNGVTSPEPIQKITPESTVINFPIKVAADAKVGTHKTLVCIARVKVGEETIVQTTGTGEIRIDAPLPPKKDAPAPEPKPEVKAPAKPAEPKPLSRLEQLRQMTGK